MTKQEIEAFADCLKEAMSGSIKTVYGSLAIIFEHMSKHPELTPVQMMLALSLILKQMAEGSDKKEEDK